MADAIVNIFETPSFFAFLKLIERRPGMYVGDVDALGLERLDSIISGYSFALKQYGIRDLAWDLYAEFPDYLAAKHDWSMCRGPITAIREASSTDRAAWDRFWTLLWDFVEVRTGRRFELP